MKDIEDRLKEEYDKVEVPDYMFDTSRVFKRLEKENRNDKRIIISIAASIAVILVVAIALIFALPKNINENDKDVINNKSENLEMITIKSFDSRFDMFNNYVINMNCNNIIDYQIINSIPYSKIKAKVLNSYLGDLSGEIEMYVPGGVFTIKDIKENVKYDHIDDISAFNDEDKVKVTYYNELFIPVAEEGKTYITTLNEIDGKYFVNMNAKYGFKEYDPETNIVKDDMGDEQLDIDRYLESINI